MAKPKCIKKETIQNIRILYLSGEYTQQQLAKQFNLSQSTICKIINNNIHRYVNIIINGKAEVKIGYNYGN